MRACESENPRRHEPRAQISANSTVLLPLLHVSLGRRVQMPPQLALARLSFLGETGAADDFAGLSVNGQLGRSTGSRSAGLLQVHVLEVRTR